MAQIGEWKGVVDTTHVGTDEKHFDGPKVKGVIALLIWRSAYLTKQVSWVNKCLIPMYWFKSMLFGRDISRF